MTRFERWSEKERQYVLGSWSKSLLSNIVTCKKDKVEAKRYYDTPNYRPKLKNTQDTAAPTQAVHTRIHPGCKATSEHDKIVQTFTSLYNYSTPVQLFNSHSYPMSHKEKHWKWLYTRHQKSHSGMNCY